MDNFIKVMPYNVYFELKDPDYETKIAVIKDYIDKKCLWPEYLTLNDDNTKFIKRQL